MNVAEPSMKNIWGKTKGTMAVASVENRGNVVEIERQKFRGWMVKLETRTMKTGMKKDIRSVIFTYATIKSE